MRITRLVIIVNLLRRKIYPSIQTISQKLNDRDIVVTDRTIKRDISVLKDWLQISVKYDRNRKGYYIDEEETLHLDQTHRDLEELDSGRRSFSPPDTYIYNHVHTIEVNKLYNKGFDHIEPILDAIRAKKMLRITYTRQDWDLRSELLVTPLDYQIMGADHGE